MPTYHLEIDLDNAALWQGPDWEVFNGEALARVLSCEAAEAVSANDLSVGEETTIRDAYGQVVGRAWITE